VQTRQSGNGRDGCVPIWREPADDGEPFDDWQSEPLDGFEERAAIREFDGKLSRTQAEKLARADVRGRVGAGAPKSPQRAPRAMPRVEGFGKQPRWPFGLGIWQKLSLSACKLFGVIVYHTDRQGDAWPSLRTLQAEAGLSRPTAAKAIRELKARGLVRPVGKMRRGVIKYRIVTEPPVPPPPQSTRRGTSPRREPDAQSQRRISTH